MKDQIKQLKEELIKEIISQLEILAPDVMKFKHYTVTKVLQLSEMDNEQLESISRIYWQQIEAKVGRKIPENFKHKVDFNLN